MALWNLCLLVIEIITEFEAAKLLLYIKMLLTFRWCGTHKKATGATAVP